MLSDSKGSFIQKKVSTHACTSPQVSFIIPSLGSSERLKTCLNSILNQQTSDTTDFEIIVMVGKNADCVDFAFPKRIRIHYFPSATGASSLRNLGANMARGQILYFLDDDCVLDSPFVLQNFISKVEEADVAWCGQYLSHSSSTWAGDTYNSICRFWLGSRIEDKKSSVFLGGNFVVRNQFWSSNRLHFDESLEKGGEELALAHKLKTAGFPLNFSPDLKVHHLSKHSTISCLTRAWTHGTTPSRDFQEAFSLRKGLPFLPLDPLKLIFILVYFCLTRLGRSWFLLNRKTAIGQAETCPTVYAK